MSSRLCTLLGLALSVVLHGIAAAAPFAYITNAGSDTVSVIDIDRNVVATTIQVGTSPQGVAVNKTGTLAYVANAGSNTVITTVPVGPTPLGVVVNPAGTRIYVVDIVQNVVMAIDIASRTVIARMPVGLTPAALGQFIAQGVAPAPKSSHFYAAHGFGCETTLATFPDWELEDDKLFNAMLPDAMTGACATGTIPVYRLYNNGMGDAPNHRFVTSFAERQNMINLGWTPEGSGSGVGMCVPQ